MNRLLLFDLDGTLIDSNGIWVEVDLAFLGRHGLTPTDEYAYTCLLYTSRCV